MGVSLRDHIRSEDIRKRTGVSDIISVINEKKWRWAGHVARLKDNRWTSRLTFWTPYGERRKRGRPTIRWRDDLNNFRKHWHHDAYDRQRWKNLEKAYVQQRALYGFK